MLSKITIEVDFSNQNTPVIQILSRNSDDVRDKLIKAFYEVLGHSSSWARIVFRDNGIGAGDEHKTVVITPMPPHDLFSEGLIMLQQHRMNRWDRNRSEEKPTDAVPRRRIESTMQPAEKAILDAMREVEKVGAHENLTKVGILLDFAKDMVSDYIDYKLTK